MLLTCQFANHSFVDPSAIINIQGKDIHKVLILVCKTFIEHFDEWY